MAAVPACRGGQTPTPIGSDDCHHGLVVAVLISNRSPMRWPKLVGRFHLPSAVCPPSVFGETPSDRLLAGLEALDAPGAQSFMTHNPHRGGRNWSVASAFRPTFVRLPDAFSTFGPPLEHPPALGRELGRTLSVPLRLPSAFAVRREPPWLMARRLPRSVHFSRSGVCAFRDRRQTPRRAFSPSQATSTALLLQVEAGVCCQMPLSEIPHAQ